jgi:hypothetical protein
LSSSTIKASATTGGKMQAMADALGSLSGQDPVIIVFTHGWRHDGRSDDSNLQNFCLILKQAAIDAPDRPVFGVYATWRGLDHFKAYTWSAVVAHNLVLFARLKPA